MELKGTVNLNEDFFWFPLEKNAHLIDTNKEHYHGDISVVAVKKDSFVILNENADAIAEVPFHYVEKFTPGMGSYDDPCGVIELMMMAVEEVEN